MMLPLFSWSSALQLVLIWLPFSRAELLLPRLGKSGNVTTATSSCTSLRNHGSHVTAEIHVGTPPQAFDLVADTGSNALVVSSCVCRKKHRCFPDSKCFTANSSSFFVPRRNHLSTILLSFGSGQIEAAFTTDIVQVAKVPATMENALLLMLDHRLNVQGPFEGILGLGLPRDRGTNEGLEQIPPGFLEKARIDRFSICFGNDGDADGALRLNTLQGSNALGSIGRDHWGLDFRGISAGKQPPPASCSMVSKTSTQVSPCGAIPDSGTTLIMGPSDQLIELFNSLCDAWPRCSEEATRSAEEKYQSFLAVLSECESWLTDSDIADELPPLHLHLVGSAGNTETLNISAAAYVLMVAQDEAQFLSTNTFGALATEKLKDSHARQNVCIPAFGQFDFPTKVNGPVWILGMPVFYEHQVGYDLSAEPPSITFSHEPCGSCVHEERLFSFKAGRAKVRQPRHLRALPRLPSISTKLTGDSFKSFF